MLSNILQRILSDKYKIITSCIGIIPVVIEWNQIIEDFWRYSSLIFFVLLVMALFLLYNHFFLNNISTDKVSKETLNTRRQRQTIIKKVLIYLTIATVSIITCSIIYIYKRPIHYVLIKNNISKEAADKVCARVNNMLNTQGLSDYRAVRRAKKRYPQKNDYLVSINGGYLSLKEASRTFEMLSKKLPGEREMELKSSNASPIRKLEYMGFYFSRIISTLK